MVSGVVLWWVVNLHPWWPLAWIAPIPLLLAAFHAADREAVWLGFLAGLIGHASNFAYFRITAGGALVAIGIILLQAFAWAGTIRFARRTVLRSSHWLTVLAYPLAWAALDTVVTALSPHASFGSLAYSQGDALPVIQITMFTGAPGIVFVISLFASAVAVAFYRRKALYLSPLLLVAGVLVFGEMRLAQPGSSSSVKIAAIAIDDFAGPRVPETDRIWERYETEIARSAAQGAKIILLPEKIEVLDSGAAQHAAPQRLDGLAAAARQNAVYLVAGLGQRLGLVLRNRMWMFDPSGELVASYDKHHLVPGLEAEFKSGEAFTVQNIAGVRYGFAICKDTHFPSLGRAYGRRRVNAMLIPAWDFQRDAWMAERITALRGVENGYSVIRASREGLLTVSDNRGRVLARAESRALPGATLLALAPMGATALTPYSRVGDVFGWTCLLAAIALRGWPVASNDFS